MDILSKNKISLTLLLLFIIGIFGYRFFIGNAPEFVDESAASAGQDLVELSDKITQSHLTSELFSVRAYRYLMDFTVPIKIQPFGRTNPFGTIGGN